jgi:hypothetical protein
MSLRTTAQDERSICAVNLRLKALDCGKTKQRHKDYTSGAARTESRVTRDAGAKKKVRTMGPDLMNWSVSTLRRMLSPGRHRDGDRGRGRDAGDDRLRHRYPVVCRLRR